MSSIGGKAERLATDTLREVVDRCRDELPGAMFVYAVPPQFMSDVVPRYPALQQRLRAPARFSRANHFSPQISLEHLDLAEDDLMLAIGEKLVPIFETAFGVILDEKIQHANAAILANVARDVFLDVSHRRLFIKTFVTELARQHAEGERGAHRAGGCGPVAGSGRSPRGRPDPAVLKMAPRIAMIGTPRRTPSVRPRSGGRRLQTGQRVVGAF